MILRCSCAPSPIWHGGDSVHSLQIAKPPSSLRRFDSNDEDSRMKRIAIVGGGISGLSAAFYLEMPPPTMAIRFMRLSSSLESNLLRLDGGFAICTERGEPSPCQIGDGAHEQGGVIQGFRAVQLHAVLPGEIAEQNVNVEQDFHMVADEADRLHKQASVTGALQARYDALHGRPKPLSA